MSWFVNIKLFECVIGSLTICVVNYILESAVDSLSMKSIINRKDVMRGISCEIKIIQREA
jgi:hypothetical protein